MTWGGISHPLTGTLGEVQPRLATELVPPSAVDRIRSVADHLPAAVTRHIYFEYRLACPISRVDLILKVERDGLEILAGRNHAQVLPPGLLASPVWRRVQDTARRCLDEPDWRRAVEALWLEFDLPEDHASGGAAQPRVFIELERAWLAAASPSAAAALVGEVTRPLTLGPRAAASVLEATMRALPAHGEVVYVGCDPARGDAPLRLCVAGLDRHELAGLLRGLGRAETAAAVVPSLDALDTPSTPLLAHLDVDDDVRPGIGIEVSFDRAAQLRGRVLERAFLARLVDAGLCRAQVSAALCAWPGVATSCLPDELWPSLFVRRINNVKLRVEPNGVTEAKGYLCFQHGYWRKPARAIGADLYPIDESLAAPPMETPKCRPAAISAVGHGRCYEHGHDRCLEPDKEAISR
jgi:hypothetical protein